MLLEQSAVVGDLAGRGGAAAPRQHLPPSGRWRGLRGTATPKHTFLWAKQGQDNPCLPCLGALLRPVPHSSSEGCGLLSVEWGARAIDFYHDLALVSNQGMDCSSFPDTASAAALGPDPSARDVSWPLAHTEAWVACDTQKLLGSYHYRLHSGSWSPTRHV